MAPSSAFAWCDGNHDRHCRRLGPGSARLRAGGTADCTSAAPASEAIGIDGSEQTARQPNNELKIWRGQPFDRSMNATTISGMQHESTRQSAQVLVAKKSLQNTRMEGRQALRLIESATVPPPTATRGTIVNRLA